MKGDAERFVPDLRRVWWMFVGWLVFLGLAILVLAIDFEPSRRLEWIGREGMRWVAWTFLCLVCWYLFVFAVWVVRRVPVVRLNSSGIRVVVPHKLLTCSIRWSDVRSVELTTVHEATEEIRAAAAAAAGSFLWNTSPLRRKPACVIRYGASNRKLVIQRWFPEEVSDLVAEINGWLRYHGTHHES